MTYKETVEWLIKVKEDLKNKGMSDTDSGLKQLIDNAEYKVLKFEQSAFEVILSSIISERKQIQLLTSKKDNNSDNDFFQMYVDAEIEKHKKNIVNFGEQVYSLYSRENIISSCEAHKNACQARINYQKKVLEENPNDKVSKISLSHEINYMEEIKTALDILNGYAIDLHNAYLPISEIGRRL